MSAGVDAATVATATAATAMARHPATIGLTGPITARITTGRTTTTTIRGRTTVTAMATGHITGPTVMATATVISDPCRGGCPARTIISGYKQSQAADVSRGRRQTNCRR